MKIPTSQHCVGEGKGGMFWENSIETIYTIKGETDHQPRLDA